VVAILNGHIVPDFPYISDTGTTSPESCIFGQLLTIGAFLSKLMSILKLNFVMCMIGIYSMYKAFLVVYIRYHHVEACTKTQYSYKTVNFVAYIFGLISCLCVTLVGNFQVLLDYF